MNEEDLITYHWLVRLPFVLLGWEMGFIGSFFLWLGLAIEYPIFAEWEYTLLVFEIAGSVGFALLAGLRQNLVRRIVKRGFVFTFVSQKVIFWAYYGAFLIALYPLLSFPGTIPGISPLLPSYSSLGAILIGLFFFLVTPRFVLSRLLWEDREARLSLLQFLEERTMDSPRYSWLRLGMRGVEERLRRSGLSVIPGVLYHGSCYSLFKESLTNGDLRLLAGWLIHPAHLHQVNSTVSGLIWDSGLAEKAGFGKVHGIWSRLLQLPWTKGYGVFVAIGVIAGSITAIIALLKVLNILPS